MIELLARFVSLFRPSPRAHIEHHECPCGGWGNEYSLEEFLRRLGGSSASCSELNRRWEGHRNWEKTLLSPPCFVDDFEEARWQSSQWKRLAMAVQDDPGKYDR